MQFEEFAHQTVLITGAASGIGAAQCQAFLDQGASVIAIDQQPMPKAHAQLLAFEGSVTDMAFIQASVTKGVAHFGGLDIVCNTAGQLDGYANAAATSVTDWEHSLDVNLTGQFRVIKATLDHFLAQHHGVYVNMSSVAGMVAGGGGMAYTAAKHAVIGMTKQLDLDYASQGIRANCLAPGAINTPMNAADFEGDGHMAAWVASETPAKRWATAAEVADLTLFIASRHADYMHGTVLPIDGGWLEK